MHERFSIAPKSTDTMERVGTLIHKLLEQYEQQAQAGRLLMTAQMLLAELQQHSYSADNNTSEKVTVVIPSASVPLNRVQPDSNIIPSSEIPAVSSLQAPVAGGEGQVAAIRPAAEAAPAASLSGDHQASQPVVALTGFTGVEQPKDGAAGQEADDHGVQISVLQGSDFADPTIPIEQGSIHVEAPIGVQPGVDSGSSIPAQQAAEAVSQQELVSEAGQDTGQQATPAAGVPPAAAFGGVAPTGGAGDVPAATSATSSEQASDPLAAFFPAAALWRQPVQQQPTQQQPVSRQTDTYGNATSSTASNAQEVQPVGSQPPVSNEVGGKPWPFDPLSEVPTLAQQQQDVPQKSDLNDSMASVDSESLNEKLRVEQIELGSMLQGSPIRDLKKAIGINDRYLFINELFRGDETMYERSLKTINGFSILPEAQYWIQRELKVKLGWNESSESVHHFDQLVKRRFS